MIQVKKKISKKNLPIVITASVLLLLIIGYVIVSAVVKAADKGSSGEEKTPIELYDGEAAYNGSLVAYPYVATTSMLSVEVKSHKDDFNITRPEVEEGKYADYFLLSYFDESGNERYYAPEICSADPYTDYTDFYAIESRDGLNAYKIHYLCSAIGALYFDERIEPEEDYTAQLNRYGLTVSEREMLIVKYVDSEGKEQTHKIYIGDSLISGVGYYFMVDDRPYIYTSSASDRFDYLLEEFETFLHSRVIAEGLEVDGLYEPYFTPNYTQWTNEYYSIGGGNEGMTVQAGSELVVNVKALTPRYNLNPSTNQGDGYLPAEYSTVAMDLSYIAKQPNFDYMLNTLLNSKIGHYTDNEIVSTVINNINDAKLGVEYSYYIREIEAVLTDMGDVETAGYPVGDSTRVKITYDYSIDGVDQNNDVCHAVIDLSKESVIPAGIIDKIKNGKVGDAINESFDVTYTEDNAEKRDIRCIVTAIDIISTRDENGNVVSANKIDENSIVTFRYKYYADGVQLTDEQSYTLDLSAVVSEEDISMRDNLIGKSVGTELNLTAYKTEAYCQPLMDFVTYRIKTIQGFVKKETVVSFRYLNESERDPFYGESIYKNTLSDSRKHYALDSGACEQVVYLLGGIGGENSSQVSGGLVGIETVAVGITPEILDKYNLYDGYTVYFELPRYLTQAGTSADDEFGDYKYLDTLGFYLYIGKTETDGTRYLASSMYDIVVKVDGARFDYLEKSFEEFWMRRDIAVIESSLIDKMNVEFNMDDFFGSYELDLDHEKIYISSTTGGHYSEMPPEGGSAYNFITVTVRPLSESMSDSVFADIIASSVKKETTLATLYDKVAGKLSAEGHDTSGTANFKRFLQLIYSTDYLGILTEEEQERAEGEPLMSIAFKLDETQPNVNAGYYCYDFYRVSDRRVMVNFYQTDTYGEKPVGAAEVTGFYISTFAMKKMVNAFDQMLNGERVNVNATIWN